MSRCKRVFFQTLGCKVNQYESAWLAERFQELGYLPTDSGTDADVVVVHTCTVTSKSNYQCRQAIRKTIRQNPKADVLVTGCYARLNPEELMAIEGVKTVFTQNDFHDILKYLQNISPSQNGASDTLKKSPPLSSFLAHSRAFVKIQDGCNSRCAYCIVPQVRGKSRSRKPEAVIEEIGMIESSGYREVVLTGIHLGAYGEDISPKLSLASLLLTLLNKFNRLRFRLSSIEPHDMNEPLLDLLDSERLCPHFHLPLQSASPRILKQMNRPYIPQEYADLVKRILTKKTSAAIGTDIMVGFPTETEVDFQQTKTFIESLDFAYLHVFAYSPRPGTPAAAMNGQLPPPVKKERSKILREISKQKRQDFIKNNLNTIRPTIVLDKSSSDGNYRMGLTDNYIQIFFPNSNGEKKYLGEIVPTCLIQLHHDGAGAIGLQNKRE